MNTLRCISQLKKTFVKNSLKTFWFIGLLLLSSDEVELFCKIEAFKIFCFGTEPIKELVWQKYKKKWKNIFSY